MNFEPRLSESEIQPVTTESWVVKPSAKPVILNVVKNDTERSEEVREIREINLNDFNWEQIHAIWRGVKWGVDVSKFLNPDLDAQQMLEIIHDHIHSTTGLLQTQNA